MPPVNARGEQRGDSMLRATGQRGNAGCNRQSGMALAGLRGWVPACAGRMGEKDGREGWAGAGSARWQL